MKLDLKLSLVFFYISLSSCSGIFIAKNTSKLWGENGEKWSSNSRLPDFSFAGLNVNNHQGDIVNVLDFGADKTGKSDSTQAFKSAILSIKDGTVFIPSGRFLITDVLKIQKRNVVLDGAGRDKTFLIFPYSLTQVLGNSDMAIKNFNKYAFTGAFIEVVGRQDSQIMTRITSNAVRGDSTLIVEKTSGLVIDQYVRLTMNNSDELGKYLHNGEDAGQDTLNEIPHLVDTVVKIVQLKKNEVEIDRPLRTDIRIEWQPTLSTYAPTVDNVGIENFTIEFLNKSKQEHLREEGYNAIMLKDISNSWVKNLRIINADNAINVNGVRFCEVSNVILESRKLQQEITGHHGLWAKGNTQGCIFHGFRITTKFVHDLSVEGLAHGNVFKNGSGKSLNFDHHRNAPYENLFSNIYVGNPKRMWDSGGRKTRGPRSGVRSTFWHVNYGDFPSAKIPNWPLLNYIGKTREKTKVSVNGVWIEKIHNVKPNELFNAQKKKRTRTQKYESQH